MCGIVAYLGEKPAQPILIEGLKRLEYRGYDSAGVALLEGGSLRITKAVGRIASLEAKLPAASHAASTNAAHAAAEGKAVVGRLAPVLAEVGAGVGTAAAKNGNGHPHTGTGGNGHSQLATQSATATTTGTKGRLNLGIAHTRWATHGGPSEANAHPHVDEAGRFALVHNGIIENHSALREYLTSKGHVFTSETDTEVLVHMIEEFYAGDLESAVRQALREVTGTYGIAVVCRDEPDTLVAARNGSPLLVGLGEGETLVASDASAIVQHTRQVIYLSDHEVVRIRAGQVTTSNLDNVTVTKKVEEVELSIGQIERNGYDHFMLKEIFEQPESIALTLAGRIDLRAGIPVLGGLSKYTKEIARARRIIFTGCGTAWHAGLIGEYLLEDVARIPTETEYASEFRYKNPIIEDGTVVIGISQSGETADTLAAVREARLKGALALGIVNVVGSTIARECDAGVYLHAGPEIGVASTKAFTSQVVVAALMSVFLGRRRHLSQAEATQILTELQAIPAAVKRILEQSDKIKKIAAEYVEQNNWLYLGRGYNYPVALEGALKLKEISYIHAEGLPAAEMKHGPIALISKGMPVVTVAPHSAQYDKVFSNIEEVRSRGGHIIAVATEGDSEIAKKAHHVIEIPECLDCLQPLLTVVPLQLLAYHAAVLLGRDVDKPRNLAKSVTVE
jgi:glucosamine--fructose-6-phosphate aminotransferase (isomerizing)